MDAISEYQKWKQQGESLRLQAKQAMEARFRDLLLEAARIAQEYHSDFGGALKPPAAITTFRYKTAAGSKAKKKGIAKKQEPPTAGAVTTPSRSRLRTDAGLPSGDREGVVTESHRERNLADLQRRRVQVQKKLEAAKIAGKQTRNLEDRLYQIEDEIRLAGNAA